MIERLPRIVLLFAAAALLMVALSGPGYRLEMFKLSVAFGLLRAGGYVAIVAAAAAIVLAIFVRRNPGRFAQPNAFALVCLAIVAGLVGATYPVMMMWQSKHVPPIHDITTDLANPPGFVSLAPVRVSAGAANPVTYGGETVAAQQRAAFADIKPLRTHSPPAETFQRALAAARDMGWRIISESSAEGRIEASDTTPFFGFIDDVVVRISAEGAGSRVDVRSLSRIGRSDLGANARRVANYLAKLGAAG